jgi:Pentapeptide repeats (8 copies)
METLVRKRCKKVTIKNYPFDRQILRSYRGGLSLIVWLVAYSSVRYQFVDECAHIEILRHGPKVWNAWRDQNLSQNPNLDQAALNLSERQLGPINGGPINLRATSLRRALLRFAGLSRANLEDADLSEADLVHARLDEANLTAANLSCAVLDHADLRGAILFNANLTGASLRHVQNLTQSQINHSICDVATIFPAHLVHPIATLRVVRKANAAWSDRTQLV